MSLPSGLFSPPPSMVAPRPPDNPTGYPHHTTLAMARTRSGGTMEGGRKVEGKGEDPVMGPVYHTQEIPPRFQHQQQQTPQQHRGSGMR